MFDVCCMMPVQPKTFLIKDIQVIPVLAAGASGY